jgi:DNA-binding transcriptional LysR family regulator
MTFDWDDLRYFLAVARKGSTTAAALHLGGSASTVARRVTALEESLATKLFERGPDGYHLTDVGAALLPAAEATEAGARGVVERLAAWGRGAKGTVRLTTIEPALATLVMPALVAYRPVAPDVQVEVHTSDDRTDLVRGDAEVALRFASRPVEPTLVARLVGHTEVALYYSRSYAEAHGVPHDATELARHLFVGGSGRAEHVPLLQWLTELVGDTRFAHRANSLAAIAAAVRQGLGIGPVSALVGDADPDLLRLDGVAPVALVEVWLVTSEEARTRAPVRSFLDFYGDWLAAQLGRWGPVDRSLGPVFVLGGRVETGPQAEG